VHRRRQALNRAEAWRSVAKPQVTGVIELHRESLGALRLRADAPRLLTLTAIGVLALVGVRHIIAPPAPVTVSRTVQVPAGSDAAPADAIAQDFARAFLSFDGSDPSGHDQRLAGLLAPGVDLSQTVIPSGPSDNHHSANEPNGQPP